MPYSENLHKNHLYSVFIAPRGLRRMAMLGMQVARQYPSPFDQLIGEIGKLVLRPELVADPATG